MPKRKRSGYAGKSRKRRRTRRFRGRRSVYAVGPQKSLLPSRTIVKMPYQADVSLDAGAGTAAVHVFTANGVYDPDITGTGHQPRSFDQYMLLYQHYVVIGSKITVKWQPSSAAAGLHGGIALAASSSVESDINNYLEAYKHSDRMLTSSGGSPAQVNVMRFSPKRFLGRSKPLSDPDLKGNVSSNPQEQAYYHVFVQQPDGSNPSPVYLSVMIEYLVALIEPAPLAAS